MTIAWNCMTSFEYLLIKNSELSAGTRFFLTPSFSSYTSLPLPGMVATVDNLANSASVNTAFCCSKKQRFQKRKNYGVYKEHQQPTLISLVKKEALYPSRGFWNFERTYTEMLLLGSVQWTSKFTCAIVNRNFKWRGMLRDTEEYVKTCQTCQQTKSSHQKPHGLTTAYCYSGKEMGRHF